MNLHTDNIRRWDAALLGLWSTVLVNKWLVTHTALFFFIVFGHGSWRGNVCMDSKNEHPWGTGCCDSVFYDSWRVTEWYKRYTGSGRPTAGPRVHFSAPSPKERLDLEAAVCPGGRSHFSHYWPGDTSSWMSAMSLTWNLLRKHMFFIYLRKKRSLNLLFVLLCRWNLTLTEVHLLSSIYYREKVLEMCLR